jgi:erythromycin esterase-like protein
MSLRAPFVIFLIALTAYAQPQTASKPKQTLEEALVQARTPLVLHDGKLSGLGAAVLNTAVQQSRFVMLGESHMTREIPRFTAALCDIMHPDAYAVEASPSAAHFVNGVLNKPNRK